MGLEKVKMILNKSGKDCMGDSRFLGTAYGMFVGGMVGGIASYVVPGALIGEGISFAFDLNGIAHLGTDLGAIVAYNAIFLRNKPSDDGVIDIIVKTEIDKEKLTSNDKHLMIGIDLGMFIGGGIGYGLGAIHQGYKAAKSTVANGYDQMKARFNPDFKKEL